MLLWHGSRLTNWVGILSQGLRIAPPEAPVTGYMFGKGVYFADMVSKSANYCFTSRDNNIGLLLCCEVALGECNEKLQSDYNANLLPAGKMSTKGCGKTAPPPDSYVDLEGYKVPLGKGQPTGVNGSLLYNEYIVYDVAQIRMKYLFKIRFDYK
jgi:poly [ADP-ribose] polymerase